MMFEEEFFEKVKTFYESHTKEETLSEFSISNRKLYEMFRFYNYKKPKDKYIRTKTSSHESYLERGRKSSETQKKNWENKSQEEKDEWSQKCRDAQLAMSIVVVEEKSRKALETFQSKTQEEIDRINEQRSESCKKFWNSLSKQEKDDRMDLQLEKTRETCLELYGVPYSCMREEARLKGNDSIPNQEFANLLEKNGIEFEREFRIDRFQYDFKINNTLIEINPTITHNSTYCPFGREPIRKTYHREKMLLARNSGYRLICVWDWDDLDKVVSLLKTREKIYARNCIIREIDKETCAKFINEHHIQGFAKDSVRLGLFYNDSLVSIMTFGKPRYNKNYQYELIRYCSICDVIGGAEKLFSYFINNYNPTSIVSYCDNSKFDGRVYQKLGLALKRESIGKHWFNMKTHRHILDSVLRANGFDRLLGEEYGCFGNGTSNKELMLKSGFVEVYDCGQSTYTWKR